MVLDRAAAGDDRAWEELVAHYGRLLRAVAFSMRMRSCDVEDATQTTWLALREDIRTIRDPERVGAWLCCVMRRRCLQMLIQQRRERLDDHPEEWYVPDADPPANYTVRIDPDLLWRYVDRLPDRERIVLRTLFDGTDHSYREVARSLSMPVGSLGPVRMRALTRLTALLAADGLLPDRGLTLRPGRCQAPTKTNGAQ